MNNINFNAVRLCFQALLPDKHGDFRNLLKPVESTPIYDSSK